MKNLIGKKVIIDYYDSVGEGSIVQGSLPGFPLDVADSQGRTVTFLSLSEIEILNSKGALRDIRLA
ncbi:MAG: hypothetical protein PHH24_00830 [Candidatus Moranbacteria bacterium]|jgi:hypothetical protein|nr:hypothetical protein [Candidatus Moranbacteria bacterium]MDD5651788.1 hypothetical protein [Candidatus Moranbacteria bacterium]